jgi:hypothetical protein
MKFLCLAATLTLILSGQATWPSGCLPTTSARFSVAAAASACGASDRADLARKYIWRRNIRQKGVKFSDDVGDQF